MECLISSWMVASSLMNLIDTDMRASSGHSWNQSMQVQLMMAGNFLPRTLRVLPTGEKHSTTFSCFLTRSMKNFQQFFNTKIINYRISINILSIK